MDQCRFQLNRLGKGFKVTLTALQQEAFFERLKGHDVRDFTEAVTTLLCAPYFPRSIEMIHETTVSAKEMRLEAEKAKRQKHEERFFQGNVRAMPHDPIGESFTKLCSGIIINGVHATATEKITKWLANPEHEAWAKSEPTKDGYHTTYEWLTHFAEQYRQKQGVSG